MTGYADIGSQQGLKVQCPLHDCWANAKSCRDISRLFKDYSLLMFVLTCLCHFFSLQVLEHYQQTAISSGSAAQFPHDVEELGNDL